VLLQNARNARVLPGQPGHLDASAAITPLEVPTGTIDRSMGDVHAAGNPHYLLDPENGLAVARLIRDRLIELRPAAADGFRERYTAFEQELRAAEARWTDALQKARGVKVVVDHNLWPYFARRYGLIIAGYLEPKCGLPPTTKHLAAVVEEMKSDGIRVVLSSPYFDPRHTDFIARATGARIVPLAHQVGSRPGTEDYLKMISYNIEQLGAAL
jgi:zinc/manganese transport system substrate-binding protein